MTTTRDFFKANLLLGDQGQKIEETELLDAVFAAYEGDYNTRTIVSPRQNGKSPGAGTASVPEQHQCRG